MKRIKVAVCDDELDILGLVTGAAEGIFTKYGIEAQIDGYANPKLVLDCLDKERYSLVFLDIDMPQMDGIQLANRIKANNDTVQIIFVSGREEKVFDTFAVNPMGFVRKSNFIKDMNDVVKRYVKMLDSQDTALQMLEFRNKGQLVSLEISKIKYIESYRNQQRIYVKNMENPEIAYETMNMLEEVLHPHGFLRVHKGYLVNADYIRRFEGRECILSTGESVLVSRERRADIMNAYMKRSMERNAILL